MLALHPPDGGLSHDQEGSHSLSEFSSVSERSPLGGVHAHAHAHARASPSPPTILHDLQQSDSSSYVLLNLAKGKPDLLFTKALNE